MNRDDRGPSYFMAAFANVYNLTLLGGALTATALTGEYVLGAMAIGAEVLWMLFAPDFKPFRRAVDQSHREEREAAARKKIAELMQNLPQKEWQRAQALEELQKEIRRDMEHNPSFQAVLLQSEVEKLGQLHRSFVQLATACARAESYLGAHDPRDLEKQLTIQEGLAEGHADPTAKALAKKNVEVLQRRKLTITEIQHFLARARGQMTLIENTIRLLRDQVLTMASPAQLGEELDDLLTGVDAIQQSARDAEPLMGGLDLEFDPVAPISAPEGESAKSGKATRVR